MWGHAYSVLPSGIYVREESDVRRPEDLAGVDVAVGFHSGSRGGVERPVVHPRATWVPLT